MIEKYPNTHEVLTKTLDIIKQVNHLKDLLNSYDLEATLLDLEYKQHDLLHVIENDTDDNHINQHVYFNDLKTYRNQRRDMKYLTTVMKLIKPMIDQYALNHQEISHEFGKLYETVVSNNIKPTYVFKNKETFEKYSDSVKKNVNTKLDINVQYNHIVKKTKETLDVQPKASLEERIVKDLKHKIKDLKDKMEEADA